MTLDEVRRFLSSQTLGVVATLGPTGQPQAALVGIAVSDHLELIFDSVDSSRKLHNLRRDARVAVVVGGSMSDERTVQCDGIADEPTGAELARIRELYFERYPDGRERLRWPGITHIRVTPHWVRWSDYNAAPPVIAEWTRGADGTLQPV